MISPATVKIEDDRVYAFSLSFRGSGSTPGVPVKSKVMKVFSKLSGDLDKQ